MAAAYRKALTTTGDTLCRIVACSPDHREPGSHDSQEHRHRSFRRRADVERKIGAVLVVDGETLVGIFTERDALNRVIAANLNPDTTRLSEVMTADPQSIAPDAPFRNALHLMYENGFAMCRSPRDGRPLGMVSARDALGLDLLEFESDLELRENISEILG